MTTLARALGLRSKQLNVALQTCSHELFGLDAAGFLDRWQPNMAPGKLPKGCGTCRPYHQPTAEMLFDPWQASRDTDWLYKHPEYKWDSIGCSVYESCPAVGIGINLINGLGIEPTRIFDWGAGPGFTTFMLAKAFPNAEVHYHEFNPPSNPGDLENVFGWFNTNVVKASNVKHVAKAEGRYDLIVGMEIVEHFAHPTIQGVGSPMTHLDDLIRDHAAPGANLLYHSCWSAENNSWVTLGHFLRYEIDGVMVGNRQASRRFHKALAHRGYRELAHGWSGRPKLYRLP